MTLDISDAYRPDVEIRREPDEEPDEFDEYATEEPDEEPELKPDESSGRSQHNHVIPVAAISSAAADDPKMIQERLGLVLN